MITTEINKPANEYVNINFTLAFYRHVMELSEASKATKKMIGDKGDPVKARL